MSPFIGFSSKTGLGPLKITKLPSQHSRPGHCRPTCETPFKWRFAETPFKWRFAGRPIIARFWGSGEPRSPKKRLDPLWQNFLDPRMHKHNVAYDFCLFTILSPYLTVRFMYYTWSAITVQTFFLPCNMAR